MLNLAVLALVVTVVAPVAALRLRARSNSWKLLMVVAVLTGLVLAAEAMTRIDVRKIVASALMPVGVLWLALLALVTDCSVRGDRCDRGGARAAAALAALLTVAGNGQVAGLLARRLEAGVPLDDGTAHFDAVLVLGGGTSLGRAGPELNGSGDRILRAAELWYAGRTPWLVTSGATIPSMAPERSLADDTAAMWIGIGIPDSAVVRLRASSLVNTEAELRAFREEAAARGWRHVGLLTSAWHMRRALRICAQLGFAVTPIAADWRGAYLHGESAFWMPQAPALMTVEQVLWEYLGALKYGG